MGKMQVNGYGRLEKVSGNGKTSYFFVASIDVGLEGSPSGEAEIRFPISYRDYTHWEKMLESSPMTCARLIVKGDLEVSLKEKE
jgi:hypothetical protein